MKLNFGRRLVLFVHWLLSLAACALVVTLFFRSDFAQILPRLVDGVEKLAFAIEAARQGLHRRRFQR